jgi:hypothetical protein
MLFQIVYKSDNRESEVTVEIVHKDKVQAIKDSADRVLSVKEVVLC